MFLMWLGEQITARGIGNGISLIIFAGIVANLPISAGPDARAGRAPAALELIWIIGIIIMVVAVITRIVFFERAQRRLIVQYPKRQVGN